MSSWYLKNYIITSITAPEDSEYLQSKYRFLYIPRWDTCWLLLEVVEKSQLIKSPHLIWDIISSPLFLSCLQFRAFQNFLLWITSCFTLCLYPVQLLFKYQEHSDSCFCNNASRTSTVRKHCMITQLCFPYCFDAWVWNLGDNFSQLSHK